MNISFKGHMVIVDHISKNYCIVNPNVVSISGNKKSNGSNSPTAFNVYDNGRHIMTAYKPEITTVGMYADTVDIKDLAKKIEEAKKSEETVFVSLNDQNNN
jgi:hypothetical protein